MLILITLMLCLISADKRISREIINGVEYHFFGLNLNYNVKSLNLFATNV